MAKTDRCSVLTDAQIAQARRRARTGKVLPLVCIELMADELLRWRQNTNP